MMHGSFVRYAAAPLDMADKTEEDAIEGVLSKANSPNNGLFKPKPDEQLVLLSSASESSGQGARC